MAITHEQAHALGNRDLPLEYQHEEDALRIFGFWIFLCTDLILFACLFATYVVMRGNAAGGPTAARLFDVTGFTIETFALLTSSFTCGLGTHAMRAGQLRPLVGWLFVTIALGLVFIGFEIDEFAHDVIIGANIMRSGFLTAFFTLVGTHGCHVSVGMSWMFSVILQLLRRGITHVTARKVFMVGLYWHFLDVVWVFIFTVVYLTGVMGQ